MSNQPPPTQSPSKQADVADAATASGNDHERIYTSSPDELQLTVRAIITGCVIGGIVGAMNITIGLKIGWSFGGSIISAVLGFAFWATVTPIFNARKFGVLETNIAQTTGSAAGAMASAGGLLAPIPALAMLEGDHGYALNYLELTLWCLGVGYLGVFFAVPLRRQMVVVEKLRFPSGTATAETIVSIFAEGAEAIRRARVLLIWAIIAAAYVVLKYNWHADWIGPQLQKPLTFITNAFADRIADGTEPAIVALIVWLASMGFVFSISASMIGAGLLIGPRVGISLLLGSIIAWGFVGTYAQDQGWAAPTLTGKGGVRDWVLWPGVAIMVADSLTALALSWRTILNTFRRTPTAELASQLEPEDQSVPNSWWVGGLVAGSVLAIFVTWQVFGIPPWMTVVAIALSAVLSMIAVRSSGETDINPVGGMGKVTQLAFAGVAPGQIVTNLMSAAITGAGASQASDMMHDLKTGRMLGASPRKQIIAQCLGITAGVFVVVPAFILLRMVGERAGTPIGLSDEYPAPAAHAWKGVAEVLSQGIDALPQNAAIAALIGLFVGALIPILRKLLPKFAPYMPSGLALGIAFIVTPEYPMMMFLGSMLLVLWRWLKPVQCKALVFALASGLIAGEGVMNIFMAMLDLARMEWKWF